VDLDGDGCIDILSGSYSRHDADMAGLFQVLRGNKDGSFRAAEALLGSDGAPLIITTTAKGTDAMVEKICTRPTAVDLDGDGKLDLVVGNFRGTFAFFRGEGNGRFAPQSIWLQCDGAPLQVQSHGDPCFVDWDGDGDLDLLSGSAHGGVYLFENVGTKQEPRFAPPRTLVPPPQSNGTQYRLGDVHLIGPQAATRVCAADVDGDGKLDLLVGDSVTLYFVQSDVTEAAARKSLADYDAAMSSANQDFARGKRDEAATDAFRKRMEAIEAERTKSVREESTGFVWLIRQK
jgi:hypothetical protein